MVKCELCERECGNGELFPLCPCGKPLGCFKCRGQDLSVTCRTCHEKVNLFDWWRAKAKPFRVGKHDETGLIRYTPNGMPFVCEGDGIYRAVRLDRTPVRRKLHTLPTGEYLDEEGQPLFPMIGRNTASMNSTPRKKSTTTYFAASSGRSRSQHEQRCQPGREKGRQGRFRLIAGRS